MNLFSYLFKKIEETLQAEPNPVDDFRFKSVVQFRDIASKRVRYIENEEYVLSLLIPKDKLTDNSSQDSASDAAGPLPKPPRQSIDLTTLISNYTAPQLIRDFVSPITGENKGAEQSYLLGTFPKFLLVQVNRYEYDDYNQPKKLDVDVNVPGTVFKVSFDLITDELDLQAIRFTGQKSDDELLPDIVEVPNAKGDKAAINESYVQSVVPNYFL
jgi:ubiquitin carboxyl-terminal hydrolase 5/13